MLALPSTASSITLNKSSTFSPGIQFAFDLADLSPSLSSQSNHSSTMSYDQSNNTSALGSPSCVSFSGYSPWQAPYDPFAGGRMSPERSERLRQHRPRELQVSGRGSSLNAVGEPPRSVSYTTMSNATISDSTPFLPHDPIPRSISDDNKPANHQQTRDNYGHHTDSPTSGGYTEYELETNSGRLSEMSRSTPRYQTRRRPFNQDEFDGPSQLLPLPLPQQEHSRSQALPNLPVHLEILEQDEIIKRVNDALSHCAYHFVAKYQFPIPLERDKTRVQSPADREWTEWAYLLKRLATKRRIPARILYDNQIKQFVTILENSIGIRQSTRETNVRVPKDDRYMLQLISSGIQVAKILMDSLAMKQLDDLYLRIESLIMNRRENLQRLNY